MRGQAIASGAHDSSTYRCVTAAFGLLFAGIAIAILVVAERTIGVLVTAAVIGVLGAEAITSDGA